ncbi:MAG: M20 family metallopeptidase, partial [Gammaproteobacteria bacterium]|nr:M20 family metallopeptidase [Gammaproteobacteria bacterium]
MLEKARAIQDYISKIRREIHRHPELGYQEVNTAKIVARCLDELGVSYKTGVAKTGLLAEISQGDGPTILLRADMDALPVHEETGLSFQSQIAGVMHACGHDTHTEMLLGAIKLLKDEHFNGTLRFLFQPSEEGSYDDPEKLSGAQRAIREGVLSGIDAAIGLHQYPTLDTGKIAVTQGAIMAAADFFEIRIQGKSAHAGVCPEVGIDAIAIAAELIQSLNTIISRQVSPMDTAVLSICTIEGGSAPNVIADQVKLTGTLRAMQEVTHQKIRQAIQSRCDALATIHHTQIDVEYFYSVPVTRNDPTIQSVAFSSATKIVGEGLVVDDLSIMGGEDFGYIAQAIPSCFALLGTKVYEGEAFPLHSPRMCVNEDAFPV